MVRRKGLRLLVLTMSTASAMACSAHGPSNPPTPSGTFGGLPHVVEVASCNGLTADAAHRLVAGSPPLTAYRENTLQPYKQGQLKVVACSFTAGSGQQRETWLGLTVTYITQKWNAASLQALNAHSDQTGMVFHVVHVKGLEGFFSPATDTRTAQLDLPWGKHATLVVRPYAEVQTLPPAASDPEAVAERVAAAVEKL
jgi:hypothetical protein